MALRRLFLLTALLSGTTLLFEPLLSADAAPFDLSGPRVEVTVTRSGKALPISQVPNLQPGDRLWIRPLMPAGQSVHFLLVGVFLRGSTNPPPDDWLTKAETWSKQVRAAGITVDVPQDAQQTILFLAPQTGGDFSTLRSTIRGKPGAFVRASQDLIQASLDRSRLDKYLDGVKKISETEPDELKERSVLLARSLNIKLDEHCFDKPTAQQAPCLVQNTDQLVLADEHGDSTVATLTSGASADLIGQLSSTKYAGGGAYSPYIGAVVDVARIMENIHTADYQYIPALALPTHDELNLKLNNPPSFHKPKSVLVVGLPAVQAASLPQLRAVDPKQVYCLQKSSEVLAVVGAPLVFSTELGHDFVLHLEGKSGPSVDLPLVADAAHGGFTVDTRLLRAGPTDTKLIGTLRGYWGFEPFAGPGFQMRNAHSVTWDVPREDKTSLIVGREDTLHLQSDVAACVEQVTVKDDQGKVLKTSWKLLKPDQLEVNIPLKDAKPGAVTIAMKQFAIAAPDQVELHTYAEAGHLDHFAIKAGDQEGFLKGTRLDEVSGVELNGIDFKPAALSRADQKDLLRLSTAASTAALHPGDHLTAHVALKDGRILDLPVTVEEPRPQVSVLSKSVQPGATPSAIRLAAPDDLPQDGRLSFFVKTEIPPTFSQSEKIEVATEDGAFHVLLGLVEGNLVLEDSHTVIAAIDPLKSFGPSAFGPLRFRPVDASGATGDWQPLVKLVRVPSLKEIRCPESPDKPCTLVGSNLFLIDSVASDPQFAHPVSVPLGFAGSALGIPRPNGTLLYIKLRDDPSTVNTAVLPVLPDQQ